MSHSRRLVTQPVFILSSIRSGSTLLRCILDSHSQIRAPHELHLTELHVTIGSAYAELAVGTVDLNIASLEHLLWDRLLHRELTCSGKRIVVDKTPGNALQWPRLLECWPEARFVILLRDPADILASAWAARPDRTRDDTTDLVIRLIDGVQRARASVAGHELRYEELTGDPERTVRALCAFLGVRFEPAMLDYAVPDVLVPGIGDFTDKIRTGVIQRGRHSTAVPTAVIEHRQRWGYGNE